jgi:hypothetical protein
MPAAEYTRETIERIRREAVTRPAMHMARDLEWPLDRLRRVAHQHNIELAAANPTMEDTPVVPVVKPRPVQPVPPRPMPAELNNIDPELAALILSLPTRQSRVLRLLIDAKPDSYTNAREIIDKLMIAMSPNAVTQAIFYLREHLADTHWRIEGHKQRHAGGYRLVRVP